ncbi:MAG TPA: IclR family transcriptional regulator [Jiangellaceae bacterium]
MADQEPARGTLGTVRNASALLDLLSNGPAYQQLSDLAERCSLSLPTVHRLLRSLVAAGLVEQDAASSRYSLGPELVRLSERYLDRLPLLQRLRPYLVDLRNRTSATIIVAMLVRDMIVNVERIDGVDAANTVQRMARSSPAHHTAAGRLLLGRAGPYAWKQYLNGQHDDPPTVPELEGWAAADLLHGTVDGLRTHTEVAVPILHPDGSAAAALVATGGPPAFTQDHLVDEIGPELQQTAALMKRLVSGD